MDFRVLSVNEKLVAKASQLHEENYQESKNYLFSQDENTVGDTCSEILGFGTISFCI